MALLTKYWTTTFFLVALLILGVCRTESDYSYHAKKVIFTPPISDSLSLLAFAGPMPGLSADFQILHMFSVYDALQPQNRDEVSLLLAAYLKNASLLDPKFFDTYRLASSILVYDAKMPEQAVDLLEYASKALPRNWEFPFFGGMIAHDFLHDSEKAFQLMKLVLERPGAHPMAANLAASYMHNTHSKEDVVTFLTMLMQSMPEKYRAGIKKKIQSLK